MPLINGTVGMAVDGYKQDGKLDHTARSPSQRPPR